MYNPLPADDKHEMREAIIARTDYISLKEDERLYDKLSKLPFKLLCLEYNRVVKGMYQSK